ncbi:MAG TPA: hypothetical protein VE078_09755 [Thermoanaerobaculia bacterium]|nr:hypothetical protein [Thermoanaerobaculia bacterium]
MPAYPMPISTQRTKIASNRAHFWMVSEMVYGLKDIRGEPPCCVRVSFKEKAVRSLKIQVSKP